MKFYYKDCGRKVYLTLKRGAPEWCNADCPPIYIEGDPKRWPGWILLSNCLCLEDGNRELVPLVRNFVKLSGEAFYHKYPNCQTIPGRNGFLENFDAQLKRRVLA